MRHAALAIGLILVVLVAAPRAWDTDIHQRITLRAIDGLQSPLKELLTPHREFISQHSVDPDMWRIVGLRTEIGPEAPNHFLDIDVLDEPAPFAGVPRDWDAFVKRYGAERADKAGRLPWRIEDIYKRLVIAFRGVRNKTSPYAESDARYLAAVLSHYVEDSFQPFHGVGNYDGQLTNQRGIHLRFEGETPRRFWTTLQQTPVSIVPIADIKAFAFDTLTTDTALVPGILAADLAAARGSTTTYDDAYYERFLAGTKAVLERRLNEAASGVASAITAAWNEAAK